MLASHSARIRLAVAITPNTSRLVLQQGLQQGRVPRRSQGEARGPMNMELREDRSAAAGLAGRHMIAPPPPPPHTHTRTRTRTHTHTARWQCQGETVPASYVNSTVFESIPMPFAPAAMLPDAQPVTPAAVENVWVSSETPRTE